MPSTYSTSLKLELIATGEQPGTWGVTTNGNLGTLLEQAVVGVQTIAMSDSTYTLSNLDGLVDEARNAVLKITGPNTAVRAVVAPLVQKEYIVVNNTSGGNAITFGASTGVVVTIGNGVTQVVYSDGLTGFYAVISSISGGTF
jgi:hypothetical protein